MRRTILAYNPAHLPMESVGQAAEREVVVLFTDISGYTTFVSNEGNAAAMALLRKHNELLMPVIQQFRGTFVKSTGDGIIAYFSDGTGATLAATTIQQQLAAYNMARAENEEIHIRIGLEVGPAIVEQGEIIGQAVNFAARLLTVCKRDQILIGSELHKKIRRRLKQVGFRRVTASFQGIAGFQEVFEVLWENVHLHDKPSKGRIVSTQREGRGRRGRILGFLLLALVTVGLVATLYWKVFRTTPARKLYEQAVGYELKGEDEQALRTLDTVLEIDPSFSDASLKAAFIAYDLEDNERARKYLESAASNAKTDDLLRLKAAALRFELDGRSEEALQTYRTLLDSYPQDATAMYYLGDLAMQTGRLGEAKEVLQKCVQTAPSDPFCDYGLMMVRVQQNEFDGVISSYESSHLDYEWLTEPVGIAFLGKGNIDQAQKYLERFGRRHRARSGTERAVSTREWAAEIGLYQGRVRDAERVLKQLAAVSTNPDSRAEYLVYLSQIEILVGRRPEARPLVAKAIEQSKDPTVLLDAAKVLAMLGEEKEVEKVLASGTRDRGRPVNLQPADRDLIDGLLYLAKGRTREATADLNTVYEGEESPVWSGYWLAQAQMQSGRCDSALEPLNRLIGSKGTILVDYPTVLWPLAIYNLGLCQERMGDKKQALASYSRFMELWQSGDPDLPSLADARKRVARLQRAE